MKLLPILVILSIFTSSLVNAETLVRAEKMTDAELLELRSAYSFVEKAQMKALAIEQKIIRAHEMKEEDWMEWSSKVRFDGEYILLYRTSWMEKFIIR
jgi:hypothetical protein